MVNGKSSALSIMFDLPSTLHIIDQSKPVTIIHYQEEEEHEFIRLHISKYTMVVIHVVVNEQCNTGDPLETSGGLYRGPPSMLIYIY